MGKRLRECAGRAGLLLLGIAVAWDPLYSNETSDRFHPIPGDIVITELMVNPSMVSDANGEYIELYNRTAGTIDLAGWIMRDGGSDHHVIDNGGPLQIGSGEFLVLARNADSAENGGFVADYEYSGILLANTTDGITLVAPAGTVIDSVTYSEDLGFPLEAGASIELRNQFWDNSMGVTWKTAASSFGLGDMGTPGEENSVHEQFAWVAVDASLESSSVPPGDSVIVSVCLFNASWLDWNVEVASFLSLADGSPFPGNPLEGPYRLTMHAGRLLQARRAYRVPEGAPFGTYRMIYGVRETDGDILDYERLEFEVTGLLKQ